MKSKKSLNNLFDSKLFSLIISLVGAIVIWLLVVINVSPQTTRVIKDVKVVIDNTVPSQFGLEVFGESEFTADVTVSGKKYQISSANLSADDIIVTAVTTNVDSPGFRTLQLKAEPVSQNVDYTISSTSIKTVDVYFDTAKTVQLPIEPAIETGDFPVVEDGFSCGDITLSESSVTITGPSTQVNRIEKVVAKCKLDKSLSSNLTVEADVVPLDDENNSDFEYLSLTVNRVVMAIPVLRVKDVATSVTFKNIPDAYSVDPLKYSVSPQNAQFNVFVDEYDKTTSCSVGTIDFKSLSPTNNVFVFSGESTDVVEGTVDEFVVEVDMDSFSEEYMTLSSETINVNNPDDKTYEISNFNKSVVIIGTEEDLKSITKDMIKVDVDLSQVEWKAGETVSVPAIVSVNSPTCWIYGNYTVEISMS
ncbi:MAG: hypothetical protein J6D06_09755 [Clostridia bacterium]|nr:hypothetical protein [Clostridia bacterium]